MAGFSNNFEGLWSIAEHKLNDFSLQNHRLAIGVSGGADSIGLFHVFSSFLKLNKISDLVVFHINFGLRGEESDRDEAFVRSICGAENTQLDVFRASLEKSAGIQEQARNFRKKIQDQYLSKKFTVVLAHNADDLAENVLMRLSRGASLENAAGMSYFDGEIFRPWLDVPRALIRDALRDRGFIWRDDSSNDTEIYARNKIRLSVLPVLESLFPGASKRIGATFLQHYVERTPKKLGNIASIPMATLGGVAREALCNEVHGFLSTNYGGSCPVPRQVIAQIAASIHKISSGLDGESRLFQLPDNKNLEVSSLEIRIVDRY